NTKFTSQQSDLTAPESSVRLTTTISNADEGFIHCGTGNEGKRTPNQREKSRRQVPTNKIWALNGVSKPNKSCGPAIKFMQNQYLMEYDQPAKDFRWHKNALRIDLF